MSGYTCRSTVDVTKSGHSEGADASDGDENSACRGRCGLQLGMRHVLVRDATGTRFADGWGEKLGSLANARHSAKGGLIFLGGVFVDRYNFSTLKWAGVRHDRSAAPFVSVAVCHRVTGTTFGLRGLITRCGSLCRRSSHQSQ